MDLRNAEPPRPWSDHYAAVLDFVAEADRLGIDVVGIAEHHRWRDGYCPRPLTVLAALAARTERIRLATAVLIAPLYDTVSLAEEAALVDCLSGGRLELGLGAGYLNSDFELFGAVAARRYRLWEERVDGARRLWADGAISPGPVQEEIPLWAGMRGRRGSYLAGLRGMPQLFFNPEHHWDRYLEGLRDGGHPPTAARYGGPVFAMLAEDPEREFATFAERIERHYRGYELAAAADSGQAPPSPRDAADYRRVGAFPSSFAAAAGRAKMGGSERAYGFSIWTPEEAAAAIGAVAAERSGADVVYLCGAIAGVFDDAAYQNLELIARRLKPLLAEL
jgi:alkanesulfonate monooxygenase SsuD/methylene tetrahydromethanopterin reductase-like flavin-dependent oxidoreductase (luciferase family)